MISGIFLTNRSRTHDGDPTRKTILIGKVGYAEEDENERIYSIISVEKNKLEIVFKELIELIHAKYIEIDLDETDRIAISNYKKLKF